VEHIQIQIEALIFSSEQPVRLSEIKEALDTAFEIESNEKDIQEQLDAIVFKYAAEEPKQIIIRLSVHY